MLASSRWRGELRENHGNELLRAALAPAHSHPPVCDESLANRSPPPRGTASDPECVGHGDHVRSPVISAELSGRRRVDAGAPEEDGHTKVRVS